MNANFVIFETSGKQCTVALFANRDGRVQLWTQQETDVLEPAQYVLPQLNALLAQAKLHRTDLSAVAFGQGPGGFTGLRVACGLAQGLAFALDIPVIPIPSLLAIAAHNHAENFTAVNQTYLVLQDARMDEVYAAVYSVDAQGWQTVHPPSLIAVSAVAQWLTAFQTRGCNTQDAPLALRVVGNAVAVYPALTHLTGVVHTGRMDAPDAHTLAQLVLYAWEHGETLPPELASPLYVRDKIAYTTQERSTGLGGNPRANAVLSAAPAPVIVPMTEQHLAQVVEIECTVQSFPWTTGNFQDALRANNSAWVLQQADKVLGFYVAMLAPDVAHLLVIAVARHAQQQGLGRWLMHHAQQQAKRHGLEAMILEVRPSNQTARTFYQHLGFETLSVRKQYYPAGGQKREDAFVLRKPLSRQEAKA